MTTPRISVLIALLATGCPGGEPNGNGENGNGGPSYEAGCIEVSDDSFSYAHVDDALAAAPEGATITLCEDLAQSLVISREIVIDASGFALVPPVNTAAVVIQNGGDATISNAMVETTRSAFVVEDGGSLTVRDSELLAVPNYGVEVQQGGSAIIENVTMNNPEWGGVRVSGGTLELRDSVIDNPGAFGVFLEREATAILEGNTINAPSIRDSTINNLFEIEGVGVWLQTGSSASLSNNEIVGPEAVGISADDSRELSLDGDVVLGGFAGLTVRNTDLSVANSRIESYFGYGVLCIQCIDATLHSTTVATDPETSRISDASDPDNRLDGSMGLFGIESSVVVTGTAEAPSRFEGNNFAGAYMVPSNGGSRATLDLSDTVVDNNAGFGIAVYSGEANLERVEVTNTRNDDAYCATSEGRVCNMAIGYWNSSGAIVDSLIADSQDWGLTGLGGAIDITGTTFARNEFVGAFLQSASVIIDNSEFIEGKNFGLYLTQNATGVLDNSTFRDAEYVSVFEYTSGGEPARQESHYQALDMGVFGSNLTVSNTTFSGGERGIQASGSGGTAEVTITDSTWSDYNADIFYSLSDSIIDATRVNIDSVGRYAVRCSSGDVRLERATLSEFTAAAYRTVGYVNDEVTFDSEGTFSGEPIWTSRCSLRMTDVTVEESDSGAMSLSNSAILVDGLTLTNTARTRNTGGSINVTYSRSSESTSQPNAYFNSVGITGVAVGDGVRVNGWVTEEGDLAEGTVSFTDLAIGGPEVEDAIFGDALESNTIGDLAITGLDIEQAGDQGLRLTRTNAEVTGESSRRTGTIQDTTGDGVRVSATGGDEPTRVSLTSLSILNPGGDGIWVQGGLHDLTDVSVTGATGYGATCDDADFETCDATLDGVEGASMGCACFIE